jgi:hypothetical protein
MPKQMPVACFVVLTVLCCGICCMSYAQQTKRMDFHSLQQVGLINGSGATSASLQSINGFEVGNWFAGIGVGLDFYRYRSVPLFADIKRYFKIAKGSRLFIYGDGGYNFPWSKKEEEQFSPWAWPIKVDKQDKGGAYLDTGGGYAMQLHNGNAILFSIGYSYKYFSENVSTYYLQGETVSTNVQHYTYSFNRIMVKVGWQF